MANPSASKGENESKRVSIRIPKPPLAMRRFAAWVLEVSLIATTAAVPFKIGNYARINFTENQVPLNPVLATTEEAIAKVLAIPIAETNRNISPLTNLFWSAALATPLLVGGWQLFLLATTGQTTPKRWFGVRVIAATAEPPGLIRIMTRELVGRWGIPLGTAYLLWRYSGAFPDLAILAGLSGVLLLAEAFTTPLNRRGRSLHDRLAGTYVISEGKGNLNLKAPEATAIALTPESIQRRRSLWNWMRQNPGTTIAIAAIGTIVSVLGTFIGTQVYIQHQTDLRERTRQADRLYLELVDQLNPDSPNAASQRREAILAMGTIGDRRAIQFLVDLLNHEGNPNTIDVIQQALFSSGPAALPYLQKSNKALRNDIEALKTVENQQQQNILAWRLRGTKQAIAKILTIYSGETHGTDLSRTHLGQTGSPIPFTPILNQIDLSGINFRGSILANASFKYSKFYSAGADERFGTFDDLISDLSGADLKEVNLTGALLNNVALKRTNLIRATLNKANLNNARLNGANLSSATLIGASLEEAILEEASLTGANLGEANLSLTNLRRARLGKLNAIAARFQFANLTESEWQEAEVSKADFRGANLEKANFNSAVLRGANLSNAQLQNASFRKANLSLVNFRGAWLDGVDFEDAIFAESSTDRNEEFMTKAPAGSPSALLRGVNFSKAKNLDAEQISYICSQGGIHPKCPI